MKKKALNTSFGVIGLGRFGMALAKTLAEAGKDVIAVDNSEKKVKEARQYTDYAFVAEAVNEEALRETGIQDCGTVAVCIGEQIDVSVLTTMLVINMGIPHVISKASSKAHGEVLSKLGATVCYPEFDMAVRTGKRLISENLIDYISMEGDVEIRQIQVSGRIVGSTIQEADVRRKYGINIIAIEKDHRTDVDFSAQYRFREGDIIAVIGKTDKIARFERDVT